jgi:outer membrane protein
MGRARAGLLVVLMLAAQPAAAQRLLELCQAALQGSPFLKQREFELERARAEEDIVRSRLLPQLSAQGSWSQNDYRDALIGDRRYDGQRYGLTARMALIDMPARYRHDASREATRQRERDAAHIRMALLGEVVDVYLKGLQAADDIAALDAEQEAVQRQIARLRAMRERQMAKVTDLAETEAYGQSLVTRGIDARNQLEQARARLTELTGQPVRQLAPLDRQVFDAVSGSAEEAVEVALRDHPQIVALQHNLEAVRRSLESIRAEAYPQLALVGSHVYSDVGYDNRAQPAYHSTNLGLELRIPLYEGGRVDASTREAVARVSIAEQQLEAMRREIERETRAAWGSARANHARIGSTRQEVAALEQTVRAQERGFELGASSVVDLLDARRRLMKANAEHAKARYDFVRDLSDLKIRRGELTEADVASWDRWFGPTPP